MVWNRSLGGEEEINADVIEPDAGG